MPANVLNYYYIKRADYPNVKHKRVLYRKRPFGSVNYYYYYIQMKDKFFLYNLHKKIQIPVDICRHVLLLWNNKIKSFPQLYGSIESIIICHFRWWRRKSILGFIQMNIFWLKSLKIQLFIVFSVGYEILLSFTVPTNYNFKNYYFLLTFRLL